MEKRLLFLDLDGTLLDDTKRITAGNERALRRILEDGHGVIITTGRPLKSAMEQARALGLDKPGCYLIAYNGSLIYDWAREQKIFSQPLSFADVYRVFDMVNATGVHIQTYDEWDVLVEARCDDEEVRRYCELIHMDYRVIADVRKDLEQAPVKCLAIDFHDQTKLLQIQQWVRENMGESLACYFSCQYYLEIVPTGMHKGAAVRMLCELLDVPLAHTVAVGDAANDITMIETAGVGVAMANAIDEVKAVATYITERDNNHDAIAEVAERFFTE